jgi:hypothetical protein
MKVIGVDPDGLSHAVGEGIFGYGAPDGSLGVNPFQAPKVFANRVRQGIFWQPYSYQAYEAAEPEMAWAIEKRPGLPRFPGSAAQGKVLIGPSMGGVGSVSGMFLIAVVGVLAFSWWMSKS